MEPGYAPEAASREPRLWGGLPPRLRSSASSEVPTHCTSVFRYLWPVPPLLSLHCRQNNATTFRWWPIIPPPRPLLLSFLLPPYSTARLLQHQHSLFVSLTEVILEIGCHIYLNHSLPKPRHHSQEDINNCSDTSRHPSHTLFRHSGHGLVSKAHLLLIQRFVSFFSLPAGRCCLRSGVHSTSSQLAISLLPIPHPPRFSTLHMPSA